MCIDKQYFHIVLKLIIFVFVKKQVDWFSSVSCKSSKSSGFFIKLDLSFWGGHYSSISLLIVTKPLQKYLRVYPDDLTNRPLHV